MSPKAHRHPDIGDVDLVTVLSALAEPTRLRIVHMLAASGCSPEGVPEGGSEGGVGRVADCADGVPEGVPGGASDGVLEGERAWKDLDLPIAQSTLSHHLRILREAGLLHNRTEGTRCFISLRTDELDARFPGLLRTVLTCTHR